MEDASTEAHAGVPARDTWPIIVGGVHRSGTSLVRRILNAHSRIYCGPEPNFWRDFYGDSARDPLRSRVAGLFQRYLPMQLSDDRFLSASRALLPESDLVDILGRALIEIQETATRRAGKARWADKDPANVVYLTQWQSLLASQWLFLHVVRNPLDTIASIKEIRFPWVIPSSLAGRIEFYQRYTQAGLDFERIHPDRYCRLIYEQLVADPVATLSRVMQWAGEEFEQSQLSFNKAHHQAGFEDPKVAKTSTIHSQSAGRWRQMLSPKEAERVMRECGCLWSRIDPAGQYVDL
ncbi:MAG: hypothetical protein DLM70_13490 [Chloroflexi bacterium]|nr:MAG: hypothetical protein DLM70_13490 [Chloroflexota bacterium]